MSSCRNQQQWLVFEISITMQSPFRESDPRRALEVMKGWRAEIEKVCSGSGWVALPHCHLSWRVYSL